ncbi:Carbon-nitrogen hydrolase [Mortierella sp. AD094]|nr:Carbon-nitrogen hydrolase [Mortierella sp. AD094]
MAESLKPEDVDVLVLPEMAFTGYVFTSKDHIRPYLEDAESGPSIQWAKTQALPIAAVRLNAHVQVGYPEKRIVANDDGQSIEKYYNSVGLVSPRGKLLATYAKHFLYYTDENWAEEGPAFMSIPIEPLGQVGFGICMDVNPYQFKTPFNDFEFSNFHLNKETNLMLCSMAWNKGDEVEKAERKLKVQKPKNDSKQTNGNDGDSNSNNDDDEWEDVEDEELLASILQHEAIQYWAIRMSPFYAQDQQREACIVIANRIGTESGKLSLICNLFVGSSCVLKLNSSGPELLGMLPANKEGILKVEI